MKFLIFLFFLPLTTFAAELHLSEIYKLIDSDKSMKDLVSECPAEFFPQSTLPYKNHTDYCSLKPELCMKLCNEGDANYCSSLANYLQGIAKSEYYSGALFSRACKLGQVSACTNRASGLIKYHGESSLNCAVRTFELSCAEKDAWGCTMYGAYLAQGKGVDRDFDKALEVLKVGCKNGTEDPACQNAKSIISQIKTVLSEKTD